jgi:Protein of unknown function (DUF2442)
MDKIHTVESVHTDETYLYLTVDEQPYRLRWVDCSPRLAKADPDERRHIEVSPSGYGLHWPLIDEDLAIAPLLQEAEPLEAASSKAG